jgi:hypothetical protein
LPSEIISLYSSRLGASPDITFSFPQENLVTVLACSSCRRCLCASVCLCLCVSLPLCARSCRLFS